MDIPENLDAEADHFAQLAGRRPLRERVCTAFSDRAKRTSRRHRRWFRISDIEPDPVARERLIALWRASIYSRDLVFGGKSQVLCLSATPLLEDYRLPPELARGEHFNMIVDDLWMSARWWLEWFQQVYLDPPFWATEALPRWLENFHQLGKAPPRWLLTAVNNFSGRHDLPVAAVVKLIAPDALDVSAGPQLEESEAGGARPSRPLGSGYRQADAALFPEMERLIEAGAARSVNAAAHMVAHRAAGKNVELESKATRLAKRFRHRTKLEKK